MPRTTPLWMSGFAALFGLAISCPAQGDSSTPTPASRGLGTPATVLRGGRVHVRPGTVLEGSDVLIEKDVIKSVGKDVKAPEGATVVDLGGDDLYAGMIDPLNEALLEAAHSGRGAFGAGDPTIDAFDVFLATRNQELLQGGVLTVGLGPVPQGIRGGVVTVLAVGAAASEPMVIAKNQIVPCEISALERVPRSEPGSFTGRGRFPVADVTVVPTTSVIMREGAAKAVDELVEGGKKYREAWEKYEKDFAKYEKDLAEWEKTKGTDSKPASRPAPEPERRPPPEPRPEGGGGGGGGGGGRRRGGFPGRPPPTAAPPPETESAATGPLPSGKPRPPEKPRVEPGKEALVRVLKREAPLWIVAHWASDIDAALDLAKTRNIRIVLVGATEAARRLDAIKDARVVVALGAPLSTDADNLDRLLQRDDLCAVLARAGVAVTFFTAGDAAIGPAGLPFAAALGIGCGLTEDQALAAVTVYAARSLGLEKKMGTIEAGKIASLFACRGSPFAPEARASRVWVRGKPIGAEQN